ncbi:hypothetical protein C8J57DRAFT_1210655 [Mycena rebaudengoi]|nr:hypothetical protein C8J57DRAFT_1210655 [Mycena rebaudengoi]
MAMESDCVSFQASLTSSDVSDSSVLSTPELTPPSSCASSSDGSESSFFSALSSNSDVGDEQEPIADFPTSGPVDFPSKNIRRPSPLPLDDPSIPLTFLDSRRPRKLRKSRPPAVPRLSLDSALSSVSESGQSSPTPLNRHPRPPLTSPIIPNCSSPLAANFWKRNRRSSLPTIPSATFGKWDDNDDEQPTELSRAVRFQSPPEPKRLPSRRSPHPQTLTRTASTHALVSLAWTGQIPSALGSSDYAPSSIGSNFFVSTKSSRRSTWSLVEGEEDDTFQNSPISSRPRLHEQCPPFPGRPRRWTLSLATAITDDELTDEMFMESVEQMRAKGRFWESARNLDSPLLPQSPVAPQITSAILNPSPPRLQRALPCLSDPHLSATWQAARRVLLICRELIRTERHYLTSLFVLVSDGTATPAPALMLTYMPALVQASEDLLLKMESNPSAQGVAEAFLLEESKLEAAFVAWCGVAGGFFVGADDHAVSRDRSARSTGFKEDSPITIMPLKRRVTTWVQAKRNSSVKKNKVNASSGGPKEPQTRPRSLPTIRELAILPIQRVMRYALLFKDLLDHIPPDAPSHLAVERAMCAAVSIAQKSDRAQGNAAFLAQ